jgi:hypothetical protein
MLNAAGAQNSWKAGTGMKTMGKALAGLMTAKKPLVKRLKRGRDGSASWEIIASMAKRRRTGIPRRF